MEPRSEAMDAAKGALEGSGFQIIIWLIRVMREAMKQMALYTSSGI